MERLDRLIEPAKSLAKKHIAEANRQGLYVCVVATERTNAEQNALYALGRTKPGKRVTNARGGESIHNYRLAWDLCPVVDGKLAWNRTDLFDKLGKIAVDLGITWGGNFKLFMDKPHFQATGGLTLAGLRAGLKPAQTSMPTGKPSPAASKLTRITITPRGNLAEFKSAVELRVMGTTDLKRFGLKEEAGKLTVVAQERYVKAIEDAVARYKGMSSKESF